LNPCRDLALSPKFCPNWAATHCLRLAFTPKPCHRLHGFSPIGLKKSVRIREIRGGRVFNEPNTNDLQGILHKN